MRTIPLEDLLAAGRKATAQAYLAGLLPERQRLRKTPRDPAKKAALARYLTSQIPRTPLRMMENGMLWVSGVSD